jgi:hypothetical protein
MCLKGFKKLVHIDEEVSQCPVCGHKHCTEFLNSEFNRESVDKQYRIPISQMSPAERAQYHLTTDFYDKSQNNLYGDSRRNQPQTQTQTQTNNYNNNYYNINNNNNFQQQQNNNNINNNNIHPSHRMFQFFIPFSASPFAGSVNRHPYDFSVFNGPIGHNDFEVPSDNFFLDNFASNFLSNFINPNARIVFINTMQNQHQGNPPASKTSIDKLKHFKMEKKYCKKDEKDPNKLEYPTCSICLMDVSEGQNTILLPCGHMFHSECATKWLEIHNTCPLCRFELPTDDPNYERDRIQRNNQRNANLARNPNVRPADLNHPENMNPQPQPQPGSGNQNINIQGENNVNGL